MELACGIRHTERADEEERRQAEADEAEALDEGYLLEEAVLHDEANAVGQEEDNAEGLPQDDGAAEQTGRLEALEHDASGDLRDGAMDMDLPEGGNDLAEGGNDLPNGADVDMPDGSVS
ncbi:MAG: hypothetical protein HC767_04855 [Akkermansiaceae bacterium]|nr:hypothetical protein [Akkermansiaceae bacterium]